MIHYPDCPYCGNSNSAVSVVDVEINGIKMKAIQCNSCKNFFGFYQDVQNQIDNLTKRIESIENEISDFN